MSTGGTGPGQGGAGRPGRDAGPAGAGGAGVAGAGGNDGRAGGIGGATIQSTGGGAAGTGGTTRPDDGRLGCNGKFEWSGLLPSIPIGDRADHMVMGDLNGDGKPDIVTKSDDSESAIVFLATGNGRFAPGREYTTGGYFGAIALADVNHDGKLDIVIGAVSVLLGNGDGTFTTGTDVLTEYGWDVLAIGDLNGDGKLDLVTGGGVGFSLSILLGKGDGTFGPAADYVALGADTTEVALGDLNGDHKPDVVVLSANDHWGSQPATSTMSVLFGNGDGTVAKAQAISNTGLTFADHLVLGDFNGNGKLDIAISCGICDGDDISVLPGKGDGTFANPIMSPGGSWTLVAKDMNGDGKLDLVTGSTVQLGQGDGTFVKGATFPESASVLAVADMNGDGRPDVAMAAYDGMDSDDVSVLLQAADGTFGPSLIQYPTGTGATAVVLGDLNGDGKLDVVTANTSSSVSVLLGQGGGSFGAKTDYPVGGWPIALLLGDLNGDGKLDIVTNVSGGVLLGKGDGTFTAKADDGVGIGLDSPALGDLNGDGKLDVVTANYASSTSGKGTVSVRLGNGDGSFGAKTDYEAGVMPDGVALGDVNGDGKLDIAVANMGGDMHWSISVLLGQGDGSFGTAKDLPSGEAPRWITLADLNGDGKLDIMTTNTSSLGHGDGTFDTPVVPAPWLGYSIVLGDVDGDGTLDIVTSDNYETLSVGFGRGDGTFGARIPYTLKTAGLALGDLNGDGLPDVVATKADADSVFTLLASCR